MRPFFRSHYGQHLLAVGSVTGTALAVARTCQSLLQSLGHQVQLDKSASVAALNSLNPDAVLICTATTGAGDVPANILPLYSELEEQFPLQQGRPFGVISLGDSSYDDTFVMRGLYLRSAF